MTDVLFGRYHVVGFHYQLGSPRTSFSFLLLLLICSLSVYRFLPCAPATRVYRLSRVKYAFVELGNTFSHSDPMVQTASFPMISSALRVGLTFKRSASVASLIADRSLTVGESRGQRQVNVTGCQWRDASAITPLSSRNGQRCLFVPRLPLSWPLAFPSTPRPVDHGRATLPSLPHRFIPGFHSSIDTPPIAPPSVEFRDLLLRVLDLSCLP